ncbi:MAG TPA: VOC family protein [Bacteroidia bacterium]|nr:VOC family protein [Bacteroidia bacterium]
MNIPKEYLPVMPYLIIKDAKAFLEFTKTVFGATEQMLVPRTENIVMHGEIRIGDAVIMFADATEQFKERPSGMFLYVVSVDKTYKLAIDNGAKPLHPPVKQEYGYSAGFEDIWGNQWWVVEP